MGLERKYYLGQLFRVNNVILFVNIRKWFKLIKDLRITYFSLRQDIWRNTASCNRLYNS